MRKLLKKRPPFQGFLYKWGQPLSQQKTSNKLFSVNLSALFWEQAHFRKEEPTWASAKDSPPRSQGCPFRSAEQRLHVLLLGMLTNGSLNKAKSWATIRDLSHIRNCMILQLWNCRLPGLFSWPYRWVHYLNSKCPHLSQGVGRKKFFFMPNQVLIESRKSKIPYISTKVDREDNGTVLIMGDHRSVTIIKFTTGCTSSILTQVPGRPGLLVHWFCPLSPLFLPKPSPDRHS